MGISTLIAIAAVVYMLVKKLDIKITLFGVGIALMYLALIMGQDLAIKDFVSTGSILLNPIELECLL